VSIRPIRPIRSPIVSQSYHNIPQSEIYIPQSENLQFKMKKMIAPILLSFCALGLTAQTCLMDTTTWRATPTADNATIVIPTSAMPMLGNQALPAGTLIGVFNTNQQLCGVATWNGATNIALTVYGFEAGGRGLTSGEAFKFRVKLPDNRMLTNVQATYTAASGIYTIQGNYVADGIAGLTGLIANFPAALQPNLNLTPLNCYGSTNGSLSVTPMGGTAPYRYAWSGGATSTDSVVRNLTIGNYRVEITDNRGCKTIIDTILRQPDSLRVIDTIQNVRCYGGTDGSIRLGTIGGTAPYSYTWQGGSAQNLRVGTYNVTVSDSRNCQKTVTYTLRQPDSLRLLDTIQQVRCYGGNDGRIRLGAVGGIAPYQFIWQNGNGQTYSVGSYRVVLTDANGCNKAGGFTITQPDSLKLVTTTTPSTVGGATGTATVVTTGGTPNYRYVWSSRPTDTTATIRNLAPNTYTVTVTDANGCVKTTTISIITNSLRDDLSKNCEIGVYPNPVLNGDPLRFSIRFINVMSQPIHVTMRDALGRLVEKVAETIVSDTEKAISIQHLPAGIYFLVFQSGDLRTVKAVIHAP
jgi:SprB repeat/Secretion system C-terminal sorting domain